MEESRLKELNIYSSLLVKNFMSQNNEKEVILIGTLYEHSTQVKYNFKACDFHLYVPNTKCEVYHGSMESIEFYNNEIKWNNPYFIRIRKCLTKKTDKIDSDNTFTIKKYSQENQSLKNKDVISFEDELAYMDENEKLVFELSFKVKNKLVNGFRLIMNKIMEENPENVIFNKMIELEAKETSVLNSLKNNLDKKKLEIQKNIETLNNLRLTHREKEEETLYKASLLIEEKDKMIEKLKKRKKEN